MNEVMRWLLDHDPALRWQVERDLADAPDEVWQATRDCVAKEGFGARLLSHQDPDGQWAGGAFFPAGHDFADQEADQPWTATTWALNSLREWGVDASALGDTADRIRANSHWEYDDLPYWDGEVDACINAWTLANGAWLGQDMSHLAQWFVDHQMAEGGWNCEWVDGSERASIQSTLNSLIGILDYEKRTGGTDDLRSARKAGEEYLLKRRLMYRLTDGELVAWWVPMFVHPFRAVYSALRAVSYFADASRHDGVAPDERIADAVTVIRNARTPEGTWIQQHRHGGEDWFETDAPPGEPSPWLTYHALKSLRWWDEARQPDRVPVG